MLNTQITNVKYVNEQVSKMLLGSEIVWPIKPQFSFYTYQQGGSLDFKVWSDTGTIAVVIDGAEGTVNPPGDTSNITGIRASGSAPSYNRNYNFNGNKKRTVLNIPLFKKRSVVLSYRMTRLNRYSVDYNQGLIAINIINDLADTANFTITVGSTSQTRSIPGNSASNFGASRLAAGTYTVTIRDNEAGTTETRSVQIRSTIYGAVTTTNERFEYGAASSPATTGTRLRKVDVYVLSEAEAINLAPDYNRPSQRAQWGYFVNLVTMIIINGQRVPLFIYGPCIIEEGTGYTPNSEFIIKNVIKLISDSQGRIRTATSKVELNPSNEYLTTVPGVFNPNGTTSPAIQVNGVVSKTIFYPEIKSFTQVGHAPLFSATARLPVTNVTTIRNSDRYLTFAHELSIVHRTNSDGSAPAPNKSTILSQSPITGDIESINQRDSVGKISAVEFNDLDIEKIEMYGNEELVAIQTNKTGTVDNINYPYGNLPSIITAAGNKILTAVHGNTVTYTNL